MQAKSRLLLLAAAFLFSTGGAAIKATSLSGWSVASLRSGVAAAALLLLLPSARRGWSRRVIPVAAAYAATLIFFVLATKLTTAANAIFLQSTAPIYLLLVGPLLLREPITREDLMFSAAVAGGMILLFAGVESPLETAPDPARGNLFGAVAGAAWGLTIAGLRWAGPESSMAAVAAGNALAFVASLPAALPVHAGVADILVVLYLGVVQIGLAYVCLTAGIRHVPAFEASALLLTEPALNPIWAWLVHSERPGKFALAGGAVILTSILIHTARSRKTRGSGVATAAESPERRSGSGSPSGR